MPSAPSARVTDDAGLLGPADRQRLEARLADGERTTGAQVVIAIFRSLEGESLEDYSIRLAQQWRIGRKGLDNGAILLVFVAERKVRLEVGYGLEAAIPDAVAARIIAERLAPRFREGQYARGLEDAAAAVFQLVATGGAAQPRVAARRQPTGLPPALAFAVVGIIGAIAVVMLMEAVDARRFARRNGYTAGRGGRWSRPAAGPPFIFWGGGGGGFGGAGGGGFSGGGGGFGGGGASGDW